MGRVSGRMLTAPEKPASPSREEVLQALEHLLSSRRFIRAGRHSRFLRYVVEETLNGNGHQLKESLLGIEVFGRPAGYDPRVDPVVRVEAAKLRSRIEEYYREDAPEQGVVVDFPRGSYMPRFRYGAPAAEIAPRGADGNTDEPPQPEPATEITVLGPDRTWPRWVLAAIAVLTLAGGAMWVQARVAHSGVVLAVLPLEDLSAGRMGLLPETLTAELRSRLSRSGRIQVVSKTSSRAAVKPPPAQTARNAPEIGRDLGAGMLLEGAMRLGGAPERLAVMLQLVDARSGLVVWTGRFECDAGLWEEGALDSMASQVRSAALSRGW